MYIILDKKSNIDGFFELVALKSSNLINQNYLKMKRIKSNCADDEHELSSSKELRLDNEAISHLTHELNQPLMVISTYAGGCIRRLEKREPKNRQIISVMRKITQYAEILGNKIHHMKNFIRQTESKYEITDIHDLITEVIALLSHQIQYYQVEVYFQFQKDISKLKMKKIRIKQLLLILMQNSIQTMKKNKTKFPKLEIQTNSIDRDTIQICIKDVSSKTSRFKLGLSACRRIVKAHGGMFCTQLSKTGRCFRFTLQNQ